MYTVDYNHHKSVYLCHISQLNSSQDGVTIAYPLTKCVRQVRCCRRCTEQNHWMPVTLKIAWQIGYTQITLR